MLALTMAAYGHLALLDGLLVALWGFAFGLVPVGWSTWLATTVPDEAESAGGLLVASIQLAIGAGAAVRRGRYSTSTEPAACSRGQRPAAGDGDGDCVNGREGQSGVTNANARSAKGYRAATPTQSVATGGRLQPFLIHQHRQIDQTV
jgi:hypothetical protein